MEELSGKVAVVTGAASGIGLAMGRAFAAEGMDVVLADIEEDRLEEVAAEFPDDVGVELVTCDVSDPDQVDALRDAAVARFGTVHVVANNAGVSTGGPVWEQTLHDWRWVLGVNMWGVIHGIRSFTPLLLDQGEGHIVNTASMAGLVSPPFMGVYNVSKHAVVTLSETLFSDLQLAGAPGVGVSVLCPGWVRTRIHEAGRNRPLEGDAAAPDTGVEPGAAAGIAGADPEMAEFIANLIHSGLAPSHVAEMVVDAVRTRRFYVLTHPEWRSMITHRTERIVNGDDPVIGGLPT
jgi:NAD(P)-dependent dehydrogenase (short-subunit alcohol dehydrogenase family)